MSRILLAIDDVELAIELTCAFEQASHEVEHVFDPAEAILRARITPPDVLIVDLVTLQVALDPLRRWAEEAVAALVVMSTSRDGEGVAQQVGGLHFLRPANATEGLLSGLSLEGEEANDLETMASSLDPLLTPLEDPLGWPRGHREADLSPRAGGARPVSLGSATAQGAWTARLLEVVRAAIASRVGRPTGQAQRSGVVAAAPTVLVAARSLNGREIVSALVKSQLGLRCVTATSAREAAATLDGRVKAVLIENDLLSSPGAAVLMFEINIQNLPLIPLRLGVDDEDAAVGRAAWEALLPLRDALKETPNSKRAAG